MNLDHQSNGVHPCIKLSLAFLRLEIFALLRNGAGQIGLFDLFFTKTVEFWLIATIFFIVIQNKLHWSTQNMWKPIRKFIISTICWFHSENWATRLQPCWLTVSRFSCVSNYIITWWSIFYDFRVYMVGNRPFPSWKQYRLAERNTRYDRTDRVGSH